MSIRGEYLESWGETDITKLAETEQEAYGRIAGRGFMNKLSELSGVDEEETKEAAMGPKTKVALGIAGALGVGGGGYAVGQDRGKKTQRLKDISTTVKLLNKLRSTGELKFDPRRFNPIGRQQR